MKRQARPQARPADPDRPGLTPKLAKRPYAGFRPRFMAFLVDFLPIAFLVAAVYYVQFGFGPVLERYFADDPRDVEGRQLFAQMSWQILGISFLLFLLYGAVMEASPGRGSLGKQFMQLEVVPPAGGRLTLGRAFKRALAKAVSMLGLGFGCLLIVLQPDKRGWHDKVADTLVLRKQVQRIVGRR